MKTGPEKYCSIKTSHIGVNNTGCPKNLLYSREQYIVVLLFGFVFSGCLTRRVINAARIVLFKSTIRLNNLSPDKKHNFIIGRLIFNYQ